MEPTLRVVLGWNPHFSVLTVNFARLWGPLDCRLSSLAGVGLSPGPRPVSLICLPCTHTHTLCVWLCNVFPQLRESKTPDPSVNYYSPSTIVSTCQMSRSINRSFGWGCTDLTKCFGKNWHFYTLISPQIIASSMPSIHFLRFSLKKSSYICWSWFLDTLYVWLPLAVGTFEKFPVGIAAPDF